MQFEQFEDGRRENLPKPSIDTGMGLERVGAVLQGKHDNYDTDLMRALIVASAQATGTEPDAPNARIHHRVIADHLRAVSFLIADGVLPSNEGRGYVLRRIMRRAMRHAHMLGTDAPVMHRLVPALVAQMGQAYPELGRAQPLIEGTLETEETRFRQTLDRGLHLLASEIDALPSDAPLPGEVAFRLYDTYGFPVDLTQDALREVGRAVDMSGFEAAMAEQKTRARAAWKGSGEAADASVWFEIAERVGATEFLGYDTEEAEGQILALVAGGAETDRAAGEVAIVLNQTPFYAEAGGQVGDQGAIRTATGRARVTDTRRMAGRIHVHYATIEEGRLERGQAAQLFVDHARRTAIRANHSATHLLHEALRGHLGEHVAQRGSLVAPDRLRFDFAHQKAMSADEIAAVEREVNAYIRQNAPVETRLMAPDEAQAIGARALFGEKYGEEVRVVSMGERPVGTGPAGTTYSLELCGGTHVRRTGDIGVMVITAEGASAAGIRRVEALTGEAAYKHLTERERMLADAAAVLKARPEEVSARLSALMDERRRLEAEVAELRRRVALGGGQAAGPEAEDVNGMRFLAQVLPGVSPKDLRGLVDEHKKRLGSGAVLLIADTDGKAAVAAGVTDDLTGRLSAVDLVRAAVQKLGGKGGGGRPDMAQGGGPDPSGAAAAVEAARATLEAVPA
jgi:alanyl-tRNA synthetase